MTTDGCLLILSDGSSRIRFIDPAGFKTVRTIGVRDKGVPVYSLNELEYVNLSS